MLPVVPKLRSVPLHPPSNRLSRRSRRLRMIRLAVTTALISPLALHSSVRADNVIWTSTSDNFWDIAANWSPHYPTSADDVFNTTASGATATTITHRQGDDTINSFLSDGQFILSGGSLSGATASSTLQVNNTFTMNGGTLANFIVNPGSGGQGITFTGNTNNTLNGVTSNADLDLSSSGVTRIVNGLTLNGTAIINGNGILASFGNETINGTGTIVFGSTGSGNRLDIEDPDSGADTLTLGSGITIRGQNGTIGGQDFVAGGHNLINNGVISADVASGNIGFDSNLGITNTNLMEARNGGELTLNNSITNTGGTIQAVDGGTVYFNGASITGGTLHSGTDATSTPGDLLFSGNTNNVLTGVTVNGNLDLSNSGVTRIVTSLTLNGTATINNNGILASYGNVNLNGTGTIVFGDTGSGNRLDIEDPDSAADTLTLGSGITVRGQSGTIGGQDFVAGGHNLINNGVISADVSGGSIGFNSNLGITNTNLMEARNGDQLTLNNSITNTGATIQAVDGGTVYFNGAGITGGTLHSGADQTANVGDLLFSGSSGNVLNGVTVNGNLDLASSGVALLENTLTLNGTATINNNGILASYGNVSLNGTGTIVFGDTGSGNRLNVEDPDSAADTLTLGSGITVRGQNGTIGGQNFVSGGHALVNNGVISADVSGGNIGFDGNLGITNTNLMEARNSGELTLNNSITNTGGTIQAVDGGTVYFNGASITGGTLHSGTDATSTPGDLLFSSSSNNVLDSVTVNGNLDLSTGGVALLKNTLALNGTATINNNGILAAYGNVAISGDGTIVFGDTGSSNRLNVEDPDSAADTLTLGSGITVRGQNGTIGGQNFIGGGHNLVNNGVISADVSGGSIGLDANVFVTNNNLMEARNGGTLHLSNNGAQSIVNTGATIQAVDGGVISVEGTTITGGTLHSGTDQTTTVGDIVFNNSDNNYINGVTVNGNLDLSGGGTARILNSLTFTGGSTININGNGVLAANGNVNLNGTGTIIFGDTGSGNRLNVEDPDSSVDTLTLGSGITVRGQNGTIGGQNFVGGGHALVNNGLISADVAGGNIYLDSGLSVTNNNVMEARNGGTLHLNNNGAQSIVNTGATIQAVDGGVVSVEGTTITGGTLKSATSGDIVFNNSDNNYINGVTVNGNLDLSTGGTARILNSLTFTGGSTININGNGVLAAQGNVNLNGTGTIIFGDTGSGNRLSVEDPDSGADTLTVGSGVTIRGQNGTIGGQVFVGGGHNLVNKGTISADVAGGTIAFDSGLGITNQGSMNVNAGSTISAPSGYTQTAGSTKANGTLDLNGSTLNLTGGLLSGTGTVNGNVSNGSTVKPGDVTGTLNISGNYTQASGGTLLIDLAGYNYGQYSQLNVGGINSLLSGSVLNVALLGNFRPVIGDTFTIETFANQDLNNTMFSTTNSLTPGLAYDVLYNPDNIQIQIVQAPSPVPGPESILVMGAGFAGVAFRFRNRKRK